MASGYGQLGLLAQLRGDSVEAERRYEQALQINESLGNRSGMAISYGQLGMLAHDQRDYEQAERLYQRSLQLNERLGNQFGIATNYHQMGNLTAENKRYAEAVVWHIRALLLWLHLEVPHVSYNARALAALRVGMGSDAFFAAASTVVDETQLAEIQVVLDPLGTDDSGEREAE